MRQARWPRFVVCKRTYENVLVRTKIHKREGTSGELANNLLAMLSDEDAWGGGIEDVTMAD